MHITPKHARHDAASSSRPTTPSRRNQRRDDRYYMINFDNDIEVRQCHICNQCVQVRPGDTSDLSLSICRGCHLWTCLPHFCPLRDGGPIDDYCEKCQEANAQGRPMIDPMARYPRECIPRRPMPQPASSATQPPGQVPHPQAHGQTSTSVLHTMGLLRTVDFS